MYTAVHVKKSLFQYEVKILMWGLLIVNASIECSMDRTEMTNQNYQRKPEHNNGMVEGRLKQIYQDISLHNRKGKDQQNVTSADHEWRAAAALFILFA